MTNEFTPAPVGSPPCNSPTTTAYTTTLFSPSTYTAPPLPALQGPDRQPTLAEIFSSHWVRIHIFICKLVPEHRYICC